MTDLGPAVVTVIGTLGGGVIGVVGTVWVTDKSNKSSKDLAKQALARQESEARLDRRHDLNLSEQ